jgi:hypothetical protein
MRNACLGHIALFRIFLLFIISMQTIVIAKRLQGPRTTQQVVAAYSARASVFREWFAFLQPASRRTCLSILALLAASAFLSANANAGQVSLAWDAVSGATGYKVYYGTTTGIYSSNVDAKTATSQTVANLIDGTRYYFVVQAYNSTTTSAYSTEFAYTVPVPPGGGGSGGSGGGGSGGSAAVKANLVAAYGFEEPTGSQAIDASGFGNHGTISGTPRVATTHFGKSLQFNGWNNWVTVSGSASLDLTTGMTLEAWVYPTNTLSSWITALLKEQTGGLAYALYANSSVNTPSEAVTIGGSEKELSVGPHLPLNAWTHLAATYDGATQKLYVNGALVGNRSQTGAITLSNGALRIGGNSVWGEYFTGYIDEVRVYNRALTQAEIAEDSRMAVVGLVVSTSSNRSNSVPLNGLAVSGNIYVSYVLISPTAATKPVTQVQFWLDDPNPSNPTGSPVMTQRGSPFDFAGTRVDGTANAFSTASLSKGVHTITARVTLSDGTALPFIKGTFTVQ